MLSLMTPANGLTPMAMDMEIGQLFQMVISSLMTQLNGVTLMLMDLETTQMATMVTNAQNCTDSQQSLLLEVALILTMTE